MDKFTNALATSAWEFLTLRRGVKRILDGETFRISPCLRWMMDPRGEPELRAFMRNRVRPGQTLWDVGSHAGRYVLLFSRWSKGGKVHAFEPNPQTCSILKRHLQLNHLEPQVMLNELAVSDHSSEEEFFAAPLDGMSRLGSENPLLAGRARPTRVKTISLDEYWAVHTHPPDWLRLDIEGFEVAALRGARRLIEARRGALTIVAELHPNAWADAGTSRIEFEGLLESLRLKLIPLSGQGDPLNEYGHVHLEFLP